MADLRPAHDPYRVLGIARGADGDEIKAAHRRLAKRFHPDRAGGDEERFLAVQEAYQLLSDPLRRRDWDRRHAPGPVRAQAPSSGRPSAAAPRPARGGGGQRRRGTARAPRRPSRDARGRGTTWSAAGVPWWEDFTPRSSQGGREAGSSPGSEAGEARARPDRAGASPEGTPDFDVYSRSSGAAWSAAARRHFRRGDADLPSRGAWRYRGTQVVTGAEARKVAAQEAAMAAASESARHDAARDAERRRRANEESLFRGARVGRPIDRQPFAHPTVSRDEVVPPGRGPSITDILAGYLRGRREPRMDAGTPGAEPATGPDEDGAARPRAGRPRRP